MHLLPRERVGDCLHVLIEAKVQAALGLSSLYLLFQKDVSRFLVLEITGMQITPQNQTQIYSPSLKRGLWRSFISPFFHMFRRA